MLAAMYSFGHGVEQNMATTESRRWWPQKVDEVSPVRCSVLPAVDDRGDAGRGASGVFCESQRRFAVP